MKEIKIYNSNIKGYHIFKTRPHSDIPMIVERDFHNKYDKYAMIVKMPALENIPSSLQEAVLRPAKGREKFQKGKDNAGKVVGRVSANVCRIFSELLQNEKIRKTQCVAVGPPTLSKTVDPQRSFRHCPNGKKDREGGGAVIPCEHSISCYESTYDYVLEKLSKLEGPEKVGS